jgi:hypothetical protein
MAKAKENALVHPMGPPSGCIYDSWSSEDYQRLNKLNMKRKLVALAMVRKGDRQDALVMKMRAFAKERGASPLEVQQNVARFDSDAFPIPVRGAA